MGGRLNSGAQRPSEHMWQRFVLLLDERIFRHFREPHEVHELALATAIGLFWALTPLIGIQMFLVAGTWALVRPFGVRFYLPLAVALVWITNPITMPPAYYTFYITGLKFFQFLGSDITGVSFAAFERVLLDSTEMGVWAGLWFWIQYMVYQLGWPMLVGGFVIGVPIALVSYPITIRALNRIRTRKAAALGLTLAEWEERYVIHRAGDPHYEAPAHAPRPAALELALAPAAPGAASKPPRARKTPAPRRTAGNASARKTKPVRRANGRAKGKG